MGVLFSAFGPVGTWSKHVTSLRIACPFLPQLGHFDPVMPYIVYGGAGPDRNGPDITCLVPSLLAHPGVMGEWRSLVGLMEWEAVWPSLGFRALILLRHNLASVR